MIIFILIESLFVAIYSCMVFTIVKYIFRFLKPNSISLFFLTGFLKHFIGWLSGLQNIYCHLKRRKSLSVFHIYPRMSNIFNVSLESFGEGILFVLFSSILNYLQNKILIIFIIGGGLHILFELIGIHKWFCKRLS